MTATKPNYGTYKLRTKNRKTDADMGAIKAAFSEAWREGRVFSIVLADEGYVKVKLGTKEVAYYQDAGDFAADFFPDMKP